MIAFSKIGLGGRLDEGQYYAENRRANDSYTQWLPFPKGRWPKFEAPMPFVTILEFMDLQFQTNKINSFNQGTHIVCTMTGDIKDFAKNYNARKASKPKNFFRCTPIDPTVGLTEPSHDTILVAFPPEIKDGTTSRIGGSVACTNTMVVLAKKAILNTITAAFASSTSLDAIRAKVPNKFDQLFECFNKKKKLNKMMTQAIENAAARVMRSSITITNAEAAKEQ